MSRKAKPIGAEVDAAIKRINACMQLRGITLNRLCSQANVRQPAAWRFMERKRKSITDTAQKLLDHIEKENNWNNADQGSGKITQHPTESYRRIARAVEEIWDGEPRSAELLANLISALKPVLRLSAVAKRPSGDSRE